MRNYWIIGCLGIGVLSASEWPEWRGPGGVGFVGDGPELESLSPEKNLRWKAELPGRANSTPVVADGKIFLTTAIDGKDGVVALDLKGKGLWRTTLGEMRPGRGQRVGSSANSSPVTDGERLYVYFKSGALGALDFDGKVLWSLNVFDTYGEDKLWWDVGTSPVLTSKGLVLAVMQTEGPSNLICFDTKTGKELWKTPRDFDVATESGDAYTTPHVRKIDGIETIISHGADHLTGHAADDGRLLWTCAGFNPEKKGMWRVIGSPVVVDGVAVVPYGRGEFLAGVKLGGEGDITKSAMLWKNEGMGTDAASPVAWKDKAIVLVDRGKERGKVFCVDARSGDVEWESLLPKGAQTFYASPLVVGDRIYFPREDGVVFAARLTADGLTEVTTNEIGEGMIASPALAGDLLLLRGAKHLFAFGE
ncbi:PQQ-binding-like beta-propeller repeat protein [Haloferula sp. A504]|uniref:outer membrane protein assembly factor BamB family protein n=1 Tax=Haloferula sp. A504 TaxID=3373601 RepID=UPI0031C70BBE|nr:PQQ-binding-like beta-propeller repeat protein [Verrucomicrobiaceae bacterium E54]